MSNAFTGFDPSTIPSFETDPLSIHLNGSSTTSAPIPFAGGAVQLSNGSFGTPSLSFISDTNTGLYRIGADNLGIVVGSGTMIDVSTSRIALNNTVYIPDATYINFGGTSFSANVGFLGADGQSFYLRGAYDPATGIGVETYISGGYSQTGAQNGGILRLLGGVSSGVGVGSDKWVHVGASGTPGVTLDSNSLFVQNILNVAGYALFTNSTGVAASFSSAGNPYVELGVGTGTGFGQEGSNDHILFYLGGADYAALDSATFSLLTDIYITKNQPTITLDESGVGEDTFAIRNLDGVFQIRNTTDARNDYQIDGAGAHSILGTFTVGAAAAGHDVLFYGDTSGINMQWEAETLGGALIINHTGGDLGYPYPFTLKSASGTVYFGIFNNYATPTTGGVFFGIEGSGVAGDAFAMYSYQGGPTYFYVGPTAASTAYGVQISNTGSILAGGSPSAASATTPNGWNTNNNSHFIQVKADSANTLDAGFSFIGQNSGTLRGGHLWYDASTTTCFLDSRYDNTAGILVLRVRTNGTPVNVASYSDTTLTFPDAYNIAFNTTTGTKIGTGTTQKIGFWNATPVVQNTGWSSITNVTTDRAYDANATTIDELADVLGTLIAQLVSYGILGA